MVAKERSGGRLVREYHKGKYFVTSKKERHVEMCLLRKGRLVGGVSNGSERTGH